MTWELRYRTPPMYDPPRYLLEKPFSMEGEQKFLILQPKDGMVYGIVNDMGLNLANGCIRNGRETNGTTHL